VSERDGERTIERMGETSRGAAVSMQPNASALGKPFHLNVSRGAATFRVHRDVAAPRLTCLLDPGPNADALGYVDAAAPRLGGVSPSS
jgi:hypothetical protein